MRYLINRSDAIGDNVLTTPFAQAIFDLDKDAEIGIITSKISKPIYQNHPLIKEIFVINKKDSYFTKIRQSFRILKNFKPDYYYYVGGSQTPNFVAWLYRIPFRGGILSKWTTWFVLNRGTRQKRSHVAQHEIFYNVDLLRHLDNFELVDDKEYFPEVVFPPGDQDFIDFLNDHSIDKGDKKIIFIHPGMTGHTLNWPSRNYGRLIDRLNIVYKNKFIFVISHTPSDNNYLEGLKDELKDKNLDNLYYFDGSIKGLQNYMGVLKHADLFIGPSTGTIHLAACAGVPLLGIYSPIKAQSALRWGPVGRGKIKVVAPKVVCGESVNCAMENCPYYECMSKIEVDDILLKVEKLLEI